MPTPHDRVWFVERVREHQARLRATIRALGVRADAVDDIAQDAFVLAWEKLPAFDPAGEFGAWVNEIARRLVANERRKEARRSRLQSEEITAYLLQRAAEPIGSLDLLEQGEALSTLKGCVEDLPPTGREMVRLRYFDQLSPGAIAGKLNRPSGYVRQNLLRIRRLLLECVEQRLVKVQGATV